MKKVLYKMIFGLTLSAFLLSSCQENRFKLVLVSAGGTYNYQIQPKTNQSLLGTTIFIQLRDQDSNKIDEKADVVVRGPEGWNGNKLLQRKYPANADWVLYPEIGIPPVVGKYSISVEKFGKVFESSFEIKTTSDLIDFPEINLDTFTESALKISWKSPLGSNGHIVQLRNTTDNVPLSNQLFTAQSQIEYDISENGIPINPLKDNIFMIVSTNLNTEIEKFNALEKINMSDAAIFLDKNSLGLAQKLNRQRKVNNLSICRIEKIYFCRD